MTSVKCEKNMSSIYKMNNKIMNYEGFPTVTFFVKFTVMILVYLVRCGIRRPTDHL